MAYNPKFITDPNKVVGRSGGLITIAQVTDEMLEGGEFRIQTELISGGDPTVGVSITYQQLLSCNYSIFSKLLENAAIYAVLAELNGVGAGNAASGPITAASGDGMAKTHGYMTGKAPNPNTLATAEEKYLYYMNKIFQTYRMLCGSVRKNWKRYNEVYDQDWNVNNMDIRKREGNL
jgi:hypothetical protein